MTRALGVRARQLRPMLPGLLGSVRWQPVAVASLLAVVLLAWRDEDLVQPGSAVWVLRGVAVVLAAAAAFAADDPAAGTVAAVPTSLPWRVAARVTTVLLPAAVIWTTALVRAEVRGDVPAGDLTLEAGTVLAAGLAAACALARWRGVLDPGVVVAPVVLVLALAAQQIPPRLDLLPVPGRGWDAAHARWAVLLLVAVAVLLAAVQDPGAARRRRSGQPAARTVTPVA